MALNTYCRLKGNIMHWSFFNVSSLLNNLRKEN